MDFVPIDKGENHFKLTLNWSCLTFFIAIPKIIPKCKRGNVFIPKTSPAPNFTLTPYSQNKSGSHFLFCHIGEGVLDRTAASVTVKYGRDT